jgi:hypothetical protein
MTSLGRSVSGSVFRAKSSWSMMVFMCPVAYRRAASRSSPSRIPESDHASLGGRLSLPAGNDTVQRIDVAIRSAWGSGRSSSESTTTSASLRSSWRVTSFA